MISKNSSIFISTFSTEKNDTEKVNRKIQIVRDSPVLQPMIEEDRATRITNQIVKRYKPRTRLLPTDHRMCLSIFKFIFNIQLRFNYINVVIITSLENKQKYLISTQATGKHLWMI